MSKVIKYTVKIKAPYNKSLQCDKCNEYVWFPFGVMDLNLNVTVKGYQNMNKLYDNGLTDEQQKLVDARYEELMAKVKEVNPKAYELLRQTKPLDEKIFEEEEEQLDMFAWEKVNKIKDLGGG